MIEVTQRAADQIRFSMDKMDAEDMMVRINAQRGDDQRIRYNMGFDDPIPGDLILESNGVTLLVDPDSKPLVMGMTIDYFYYENTMQFVFLNPNDQTGANPAESPVEIPPE
jgi:iron-sulfur cluster assembly protein